MPRPLRVTHVCGSTRSGSTTVILKLLEHHDRAVIDPSACFFSIEALDEDTRRRADAIGAPYRSVKKSRRYDPFAVAQLARVFRELRPEVAVLHGFGAYSFGVPAARMARVPTVIRVEHAAELYTSLHRLTSRAVAWAVDSAVLVSRFLVDYLAAAGTVLPAAEVIHNGVELAPYLAIARPPFSGPGPATLLMAARLDSAKDHACLLDAVAILRRQLGRDGSSAHGRPGAGVRLQVAGEGPFEAALRAQALRLGIDDAVDFLGHRSDIPALLAAADVGVLSTHGEGFGLAVAEAMAAGRPVVATRVSSLPELVDEGVEGLLTAPGSPTEMAAALASLLADPERARRMGEAGRRRAFEHYALPVAVARMEQHLTRTAARSRG